MENKLHGRLTDEPASAYVRSRSSLFLSETLDLREKVPGLWNKCFFDLLAYATADYHDAPTGRARDKAKKRYDRWLRVLTRRSANNNGLNETVNDMIVDLVQKNFEKKDTSR